MRSRIAFLTTPSNPFLTLNYFTFAFSAALTNIFETQSLETGTIFFEPGYATHLLDSAIQKAFNISRTETLIQHFLTILSRDIITRNFQILKIDFTRLHWTSLSVSAVHQPFVLCVETSTRSPCCSIVSGGYLNTLTFVALVLVSSCFIHPFELLSIRPFSHGFEFGFCLAALTKVHFCYCFSQTFTQ